MKFNQSFKFILLLFVCSIFSCGDLSSQKLKTPTSKAFNAYWYAGEAELTKYTLDQARYGENHKGEAVLIFVTEDFRTDKQVKFESGNKTKNVEPILKLNFTKKFFTGLYPYSMMASIFTPVNSKKKTYKVTTSSQEWCGHTYTQLNHKGNSYVGRLHSYFQDEADKEFTLADALLEDDIWTKIRIDPSALPKGDIDMIPGTMFLRLKHKDHAVEPAKAQLKSSSEKGQSTYMITYQNFSRELSITFENKFPHAIVSWTEVSKSGITKAVKTHSIKSPYWEKHDVADADLRKELGLDMTNY